MSKRYTTWGRVRGDCGHEHRSLLAAHKCLQNDLNGCRSQGGYSDRTLYVLDPGQTVKSYDVTRGPGRPLHMGAEWDEYEELMWRDGVTA